MILKIVFPFINKRVFGGSIIKWYKTEGEFIEYGDDLFDISVTSQGRSVKIFPMTTEQILGYKPLIRPESKRATIDMAIRITASDTGVLRHIKSQDYCNVNDLLAVVTTEESELINLSNLEVDALPTFRVVSNYVLDATDDMIEEVEPNFVNTGSLLENIQADLERSRIRLAKIKASLGLLL